jgi:methionine-rich copper-binding protein CopC
MIYTDNFLTSFKIINRSAAICVKGFFTALSVGFTLILLAPVNAGAHAFPDHADPKVGSILTVSPERVRIWFDSALEPVFSSIMVHTADGRMVNKGGGGVAASDPTLLEVSVPPLPPGKYIVIWSVVARDGHRTSGDYTFTIK